MIISRYVIAEIRQPLLTIVVLLSVIFTSYVTAILLNDVVAGSMPAQSVAKFASIRLLIALEILIPAALYFSVIVALGRLRSDSEVTALSACGIGEIALLRIVLKIALVVALVVACLSLLARPWAYEQRYRLKAQVQAEFEVDDLEPGRFFVSPDGDYAILAETVYRDQRRAGRPVVQIPRDNGLQVVVADELLQPENTADGRLIFVFKNASVYHLDRDGSRDRVGRFAEATFLISPADPEEIGYKSKTQGTLALSRSENRKDLAEFQWRISTPTATLLLALLAVPLSRSPPRRGRFAKTALAIGVYLVFYNLMAMAKNLVQEGLVGAVPGLWWPLLLLIATLPLFYVRLRGTGTA